jgi:intracellular septation protein|tara:strand:- start:3082 stop:3672 length:591 start_codon:yes stop_codon:yes gene_type:complete
MRQLLEFLPIALFFIVYQMDGDTVTLYGWSHTIDGIFTATAVLMAATVLQLLLTWAITRQLEKRLLWVGLAVCGFGAATLLLHNELFIMWKPTIFNWALALAFAASQFIGQRNLMERTLGSQIQLPHRVWTRLNLLWVAHFSVVGALNLIVAYGYSEATWVSYKLYSAILFTVLLTGLTAWMVAPHLKDQAAENQE